jgi:hypothetical protein
VSPHTLHLCRGGAPRAVLAGVEPIGAQGVRHEGLCFEIDTPTMRVARGRDVNRSARVVAAEGLRGQVASLCLVVVCATRSSAVRSEGGNARPRRSARRRIPAQALGLKKYRRRTPPISKISDNEHTTSSLGDGARVAVHSDILSVEHSVGETIPALCQPAEDGAESPSSVQRQDAGDVLPSDPTGAKAASKAAKLERQVATVVIEPTTESRDAERLARGSTDEKIDSCILSLSDRGEIAMARDLWVVMRKHGSGEWFDLREESRLPAQWLPCH